MQVQIEQGKIAAAESTLTLFERKLPAHGDIPSSRAMLLMGKGNGGGADSVIRASLPTLRTDDARRNSAFAMSNLLTAQGRVREGMKWTAQTVPTQGVSAVLNAVRLNVMLDSAWVQAYYLNNAASAKATVKRALERVPISSLAAPDRPWTALLKIATVTRDAAAARTYAAAQERDMVSATLGTFKGAVPVTRGVLALAENRPADAAALFAEADKADLGPEQIGPWRAQALDLANQPDSAIAEFERFVAFRDAVYSLHRDYLAGSHKRLGELYDAKGNVAKAIENYEKFVGLWKDADTELQPKVREVKARLDALRRKGSKG
jgi:tetratricopeptide (TPR) repeat protein